MLIRRPEVAYRRERWNTPDGDFIDLDWLEDPSLDGGLGDDNPSSQYSISTARTPPEVASPEGPLLRPSTRGRHPSRGANAPLIVLFHGLEGSSRSHYALALMAALRAGGISGVVVHFRGCSGEPNRLPRAYHSGDAQEIDWILRRLRSRIGGAPLYAVGISLGGNALLKWLGETGASARDVVDRAVAVSAPVDLVASGNALGQGFNLLYTRNFLTTLKVKALEKLDRYPGMYDAARVRAASTLREFDDLVTAPLHGFGNADDYWTRASSKPVLRNIRVRALVINAKNDPFLPAAALPRPEDISGAVTLEQPDEGGHVGFVTGALPGHFGWLPARMLNFLGARENGN